MYKRRKWKWEKEFELRRGTFITEDGTQTKGLSVVPYNQLLQVIPNLLEQTYKKAREDVINELHQCQAEHNEARHGDTVDDAYDRVIDYITYQ